MDDILIFSKTLEDHLEHLRQVFDVLRANKLYANVKKCTFLKTKVEFLGHVVSGEGIAPDPQKTKTILEWPVPQSLHDVRSFLGLAGFYRRFISDFSLIAGPLTNLLHKEAGWTWGQEEELAFDKLKSALTSAPVLTIANPQNVFRLRLTTDASDLALGAVLEQLDGKGQPHPIAFESRKLQG